MPPKRDPYATKVHRRIDIVLIVLTIMLIVFAFRYSAHSHRGVDSYEPEARAIAPNQTVQTTATANH